MAASSLLLPHPYCCPPPTIDSFVSGGGVDPPQYQRYHKLPRLSSCVSLISSSSSHISAVATTARTLLPPSIAAQPAVAIDANRPWQQSPDTSGIHIQKCARRVILPLLAALLVGNAQPSSPAFADEGPAAISDVEDTEKQPGEYAYLKLLQKMKERRERSLTAPTPGNTGNGESPSSGVMRTQKLREAAEKAQRERETSTQTLFKSRVEKESTSAPEVVKKPQTEQSKLQDDPTPMKVESRKVEVKGGAKIAKLKTHGFMPLFLSQFLLFLAAIGGGGALLVVEESEWRKAQKTLEEYVEKTLPKAEDLYKKVQPVTEEGLQKIREFGIQARPYVQKAWESSKPVAGKVYESSKPLLKEAQRKMAELLQQTQQRAKN